MTKSAPSDVVALEPALADLDLDQVLAAPGADDPVVVAITRVAPGTALDQGGIAALAHAVHMVSLATDALRARLGAELELNAIDVSALIEIYNRPNIRPTDLGRAIHMRSAGLTALADRLIRGGYVRRYPDPSDRRGNRLRLSPAGLHAVGWLFDVVTTALAGADLPDPDSLTACLVGLAGAVDRAEISPVG